MGLLKNSPSEKNVDNPKSIILILLILSLYYSIIFSGLISQ